MIANSLNYLIRPEWRALRLNDLPYFGANLYLYIFVFLSFMWSHGDHSS